MIRVLWQQMQVIFNLQVTHYTPRLKRVLQALHFVNESGMGKKWLSRQVQSISCPISLSFKQKICRSGSMRPCPYFIAE
jgi:hypothetical protein